MSIITGRRLNYFYSKIKNVFAKKSIYGDGYINHGAAEPPGSDSIVFADESIASGNYSASIASYSSTTSGDYSFTTGGNTTASGQCSHAEGHNTNANGSYSHVCGKYNKLLTSNSSCYNQTGDAFVVGNGTSSSALSNALRVTFAGDVKGTKAFQSSGADYAEYIKEWADGNPENEDRVGYFVTVKNCFLHKANEGDYIAGITSGNPSIVGNSDEDYYWKYERDGFRRIVMEDVPEMIHQRDENGKMIFDEEHNPVMVETGNIIKNARMKLADNYNPDLQENYIEREKRKEWDYVGMVGVIPVRDDGTCLPGHFCKCGQDGIATLATKRGVDTFYVIERVSDNIVSVLLR